MFSCQKYLKIWLSISKKRSYKISYRDSVNIKAKNQIISSIEIYVHLIFTQESLMCGNAYDFSTLESVYLAIKYP